eukprot:TRINITY_DN2210_c0_g1_i1.p1 TRINITY_DN2210_c0_g1~~TRINITY_DN2210_c0_g1_i1.p1  ORF type:complete len:131 (-),score=21.18 TRINITY_DN2210_c0_g1_i1:286-678(-)
MIFLGETNFSIDEILEQTTELIKRKTRDFVRDVETLMIEEKEPEILVSDKFELPLNESHYVKLISRAEHSDKVKGDLQVGITCYMRSHFQTAKHELDERYLHSQLLVEDENISRYFHRIMDTLCLLGIFR